MSVLKEHYTVTEDLEGSKYIGITLDWDYEGRKVHLSLPGYNAKALKRFHHEPPTKRQDSPYPHTPPKYGAKQQYADGPDDSPPLDKADKTFIQQVTGTFLFSGRAVDSPLLTPLSAIASQQGAPTENTMKRTKQLLDFVASQEDAVLTYHASDMILAIHSDAGYLNEPNARSRAGGHFFLSNDEKYPPNNGAILNISQVIRLLCHLQPKPNSVHYTSMQKKQSTSAPFSRNLDTPNHPPPSRQITPLQKESSIAKSNPNAQRPWICASTGSGTEKHKNNSDSIGERVYSITPTIGPNTIRQPITEISVRNSSHHPQHSNNSERNWHADLSRGCAELTVLETQHSSLGARDASQPHRYAKCVNTYLAHGALFLRYVKYRRV